MIVGAFGEAGDWVASFVVFVLATGAALVAVVLLAT